MLLLLFSPILAYFLMLFSVVIVTSIGMDSEAIDTASLTVVYIQCILIVQLIRAIKKGLT
jgi:hypothetical protein